MEMALKEVLGRAVARRGRGMTWQQTIDLVCSMLAITDRHIIIDSARAVVHVHWRQFGKPHTVTVTFNDIVSAINGPLSGMVSAPCADPAGGKKRPTAIASP
jgi:hypothetical protein